MKSVLVAGAGPAGIAAAVRAHEAGARVTVLDDNLSPGGQIWRKESDNLWLARFRNADIRFIGGTQIVSVDPSARLVTAESDTGPLSLSYDALILATGAREVFLPFPGWTLPGIMGVGGLQALAKTGLSIAGKRIVIAGSGPLLLAVAYYLSQHGAHIVLVAEQASTRSLAGFALSLVRHLNKVRQAAALKLSLRRIRYLTGCWVENAQRAGTAIQLQIRQGRETWQETCDYAGVAYGLAPNTELASLCGCRIIEASVAVDDRQATSVSQIFCAGEGTGIGGVDLSIVEGEIAGLAAAGLPERREPLFRRRTHERRFAQALHSAFALRPELRHLPATDTIVCRCEDVTYGRLKQVSSSRAAKLHTRCGMGPCQGRVCGLATAFLFGWSSDSVRPPILPTRVGSLTKK